MRTCLSPRCAAALALLALGQPGPTAAATPAGQQLKGAAAAPRIILPALERDAEAALRHRRALQLAKPPVPLGAAERKALVAQVAQHLGAPARALSATGPEPLVLSGSAASVGGAFLSVDRPEFAQFSPGGFIVNVAEKPADRSVIFINFDHPGTRMLDCRLANLPTVELRFHTIGASGEPVRGPLQAGHALFIAYGTQTQLAFSPRHTGTYGLTFVDCTVTSLG